MDRLLDGRLAPITDTLTFVNASVAEATGAFVRDGEPRWEESGLEFAVRDVGAANLEQVLLNLDPLRRSGVSRHACVASREGRWSLFLTNNWRGTDPHSYSNRWARRHGWMGVSVTSTPHRIEAGVTMSLGACILRVYDPEVHWRRSRTIYVAHDGYRWDYEESGDPLAFEDLSRQKARLIKDRFTFDHLVEYLGHLGIDAFNEDFYDPMDAILITLSGGWLDRKPDGEVSLIEVQAGRGSS